LVIIGEVFGMHHQLGGSTEDDMNKMSVIGHISHICMSELLIDNMAQHKFRRLCGCVRSSNLRQ
jgi:hypothetical protein